MRPDGRILPAAEQPDKRAAPQLPGAPGQCPAPPSTDPPPGAEDRRLTLPLLRTGQFAPLTRRIYKLKKDDTITTSVTHLLVHLHNKSY